MFDGIHKINKWFGLERDVIDEHVDLNAQSIKRALFGCKYIIEVDWKKVFYRAPVTGKRLWSWDVIPAFQEQFMHPHCKVGEHAVIVEMRGLENTDEIFVRNEFGGDAVFVGTNNEANAVIIALKYT